MSRRCPLSPAQKLFRQSCLKQGFRETLRPGALPKVFLSGSVLTGTFVCLALGVASAFTLGYALLTWHGQDAATAVKILASYQKDDLARGLDFIRQDILKELLRLSGAILVAVPLVGVLYQAEARAKALSRTYPRG